MVEILFKRLNEKAVLPIRKHISDAGYDLIATSYKYNPKYDRFEYGVGFATKIPLGYYAEILPRSSNTKTNAYLPNSCGVIDSDYTGEWKVFYKLRSSFEQLFPEGDYELNLLEMENEMAPYKVGDAIAQCLIHKTEDIWFRDVTELPETDRGADGGINRDDTNFKV
jgi:dUTP pyrophosphatase